MGTKPSAILTMMFESLHEILDQIRWIVEDSQDDKAMALYREMELGCLRGLVRLRQHLGIPHDPQETGRRLGLTFTPQEEGEEE